jgi:hypothetical protein
MSWTAGRTNPLILMPDYGSMPHDWSAETAFTGAPAFPAWYQETGAAVRDNTHALFGTYGAMFTGGAVQNILNRFTFDPRVWQAIDAGPYSCYCFVYPTAYTGAAAVRIQYDLVKADGTALAHTVTFTADYAISTLTLNAWNLIRVAGTALSANQLSDFNTVGYKTVDYRVFLVPNAGTATFWTDGMWFGHALDFQDLVQYQTMDNDAAVGTYLQKGSGKGAYCIAPMKSNTVIPRVVVQADNGAIEAYQWASGRKSIDFKSSIIDNTSVATVRTFYDYVSDKTPVTFFRDQTSITRDYIGKAIVTNKDDGIDQDKGSPDFQFGWQLKEVI